MQVVVKQFINADVEHVFQRFADIPAAAVQISAIVRIEMLSEGPVGVGTRWREWRRMMGKESSETMSISEFEPNRRYVALADSHGTRYRSEYLFEPREAGCQVTLTFGGEPYSLFAKLMSVFGWLMLGSIKNMLADDMAELKVLCEKG